jgi:hypothetical protein
MPQLAQASTPWLRPKARRSNTSLHTGITDESNATHPGSYEWSWLWLLVMLFMLCNTACMRYCEHVDMFIQIIFSIVILKKGE